LCKTRAWILLRLRLSLKLRVCGWLLVVCARWPSIRSGHSRGQSRWLFFVVCVHWRSICGRHGGEKSSWLLVVCVYWRSIHSGHPRRRSKWMLVVLFVVCIHRRGIHGRHGRKQKISLSSILYSRRILMCGAVHADRCSQLTRLIALVIARGFNLKLPSVVPLQSSECESGRDLMLFKAPHFVSCGIAASGRGVRFPSSPINTPKPRRRSQG
jgi:hypothetical protein